MQTIAVSWKNWLAKITHRYTSRHKQRAQLGFIFTLLRVLPYPTRCFRAFFYDLKRWNILHLITDIFQGCFEKGTDNPVDFRSFSAFYMLLRILF